MLSASPGHVDALFFDDHTASTVRGADSALDAVLSIARGWDVYLNALNQGVPAVPLRCPAASTWASNDAALSNAATTLDPSAINGEALSAETLLAIADFIDRPNVFASTTDPPPTPPAIRYDTYCYAENPSAVYAWGHAPGTPP